MCKHEEKLCPRCNTTFECKAGTITQCQCNTIQLSLEENIYLQTKYDDCICLKCLLAIQKEYFLFKENYIY